MSNFIDDLRNDHLIILNAFTEVNSFGIASAEGQEKLASIRQVLLEHLKKEDTGLYPALKKAAATDVKLKAIMDAFGNEMVEITSAIQDFFKQYPNGGTGFGFAKDYGRLRASLQGRIQNEENVLYNEYLRITGA